MNTLPTVENNGNTRELFGHNIECPYNQILKQYKFVRNWQENPTKFHYQYQCVDNPNRTSDFIDKKTELDDYGNGQHVYLDRHNIECPPKYALNKIQLTGQIENDPKQIQYQYRCYDTNINNITHHDTRFNEEGNSIVYFDRHNIECPDNTVLNSVKLNRGKDENGNWNKIRFDYKCGSISHHYDYINSNNIDKDGIGNPTSHIKANIQSLLLYYGIYIKDRETKIIFSHGEILINNMFNNIKEAIINSGAEFIHRKTQSDSWCPLIWKALQIAEKNIKDDWTIYIPAQDIIDKTAEVFYNMRYWVQYADYILKQYREPNPSFSNDFNDKLLQNESKKIKLNIRILNAHNINNKDFNGDGNIKLEIINIIQYYAGINIDDPRNYSDDLKQTKNIFNEAIRFNGIEESYLEICIPLIWKTLQLSDYNIPNEWTIYKKKDKQNGISQNKFFEFASRLSSIHRFSEYALFCILDYHYHERYNHSVNEYLLHQNDIIKELYTLHTETDLHTYEQIQLLYKLNIHPNMNDEYKQKYLKYKRKYLKLKK